MHLPGLMSGRQICVTLFLFIIARVIASVIGEGEDNIYGVPEFFHELVIVGLLGALVTTMYAGMQVCKKFG